MKISVLKLGGSLFDLPDLKNRLSEFLRQLKNSKPLLICGGGSTADLVRHWDAVHQLDATTAHWLAIAAMKLNERLLCQLLPSACVVSNQENAEQAWQQNQIPILCAEHYLQTTTSEDFEQLPASWDVTSDSIAAWVTLTWPADELILLKSIELPAEFTVASLAAVGAVDAYLPVLADQLPALRWYNLRTDQLPVAATTVIRGSSFQSTNATGPA
ncbi:amino acid kinase family protein [Gimesia algae]|uniref:Uridylate kinase n=1 Tax=Gimesia algae TaxID=2527971 RepID=A0A517VJ90_9PLAN|nr:hypothetical protein [Gimesia algae]QDT93068.1 Uridylate kinase [Gimesia algae]